MEEAGEVELVGGWAEVSFAEEFAAAVDTDCYQVFLTSYDPVLVFVQNRTSTGFEIHALSGQSCKPPRSIRCAYRVLAWRLRSARLDDCADP
jgi:hypothetical protein